jgi:ABC-2 type transport system permease protein
MSETVTADVEVTRDQPVRPFYWSVRRELWENRSVYLVPLAVAAIVTFASALMSATLPRKVAAAMLVPASRHAMIVGGLSMVPAPIMLACFLVGMFYCLDTLHGERRDRSLLFWKSLPVSDRTTVLAKASIALLVLPVLAFVLSVVAMLVVLATSTMALAARGMSPLLLWSEFHLFQETAVMIYGLAVHTLWFAPVYAWLLLMSAVARRLPILWAIVPPFILMLLETMFLRTPHVAQFIGGRFTGAMHVAFRNMHRGGVIDELTQLDPLRFLTSPGLWLGLLFAAAALAMTVRLRRRHEPI